MASVAVAAASEISAEIGRVVAERGGNAVDVAVAAAVGSMCTDPGIIAPGCGGFISVWPSGGVPVVIDAYAEMPGRGLPAHRFGRGGIRVAMAYGGGMETIVGYGSVATPGAFAGLAEAQRRFGAIDWQHVIEPTIAVVAEGFPLSPPAAEYLTYSHEVIFGWDPASYQVVHTDRGKPLSAGATVRIPELARSLERIAAEGVDVLYSGDLARAIADETQAHGGLLTLEDLGGYEPISREPTMLNVAGWDVATNPPPAVGGACMAAMLLLLDDADVAGWSAGDVATIAQIQHAVVTFRRNRLDVATDRIAEAERLLAAARVGDLGVLLSSPSTSHTSAVDDSGNACAVTVSAGYGSGAMVPGTGMWLNNSLGEIELHPEGFHTLEPGTRLVSNMAPTVARRDDGAVLAIGSPGADRITTALSQVLMNVFRLGMSLEDAIDAPRVHAELFGGTPRLAHEPGVDDSLVETLAPRPFSAKSMYFGGVQATAWYPEGGLVASADPRRSGGTAISGSDQ